MWSLTMGLVPLFSKHNKHRSFTIMFDVTIANPLGPTALARAGMGKGFAIEEAVRVRDIKYGVTYRPASKFIPLAFSKSGNEKNLLSV